jgi:hypothetical protein
MQTFNWLQKFKRHWWHHSEWINPLYLKFELFMQQF